MTVVMYAKLSLNSYSIVLAKFTRDENNKLMDYRESFPLLV